jgi:hypothetical protein
MDRIQRHLLEPNSDFFKRLDQAIRPRRGRSLLSSRVLVAGLVYLAMVGSTKTVTKLAQVLRNEATPGQLQLLMGVAPGPLHRHLSTRPPSPWRLYRLYDALALGLQREGVGREIFGAADLDTALRKVADSLLAETAPAPPPGAEFTVDTTDIEASCRPVSRAKLGRGIRAADPDARWRKKRTGALDPDAPAAIARKKSGKEPVDKLVFGYGGVTVGGTHQNYGYVYGFQLIPADQYDAPVSHWIMDTLAERGVQITEMIGDRGFSGSGPWQRGVRERGAMPVFDLKSGQGDRDPNWRGCLVVQGWPYLPQLPKRLWTLTRPGPQAPEEKVKQFQKEIQEREGYAMLPHGRPGPWSARVTSPLCRGRRLGCPKVPGSMRKRDLKLAVCSGDHGDDEACCMRSGTFKSEFAPLAYQYPVWGTKEWAKKYAKRTNVERGFSTLKNPDVIGLAPGLYRIRGLVKMSILVVCMFVAHNLHLRMLDEERLAKGLPRRSTSKRCRRGFAELMQPDVVSVAVSDAGSRAP